MTLTNHLLAGVTIAKFVPWPIAIPLAFLSHFVIDALPHFGFRTIEQRKNHTKLMTTVVLIDLIVAVLLTAWLLANGRTNQLLIGLLAFSPDLMWLYRFIVTEKFGKLKPTLGNYLVRLHRNIQKYERIWGLAIELIFAIMLFVILCV